MKNGLRVTDVASPRGGRRLEESVGVFGVHDDRVLQEDANSTAQKSVAIRISSNSAAGTSNIPNLRRQTSDQRETVFATARFGERTRDAMSHKRTNGERVGNIQFGHRLGADGKHVEPDPAEQSVLLEIRRLRQSGHAMRGTAAALNIQALR